MFLLVLNVKMFNCQMQGCHKHRCIQKIVREINVGCLIVVINDNGYLFEVANAFIIKLNELGDRLSVLESNAIYF